MRKIKKILRSIKKKVKPFAVKTLIEANELTKQAERMTLPRKGKYKIGR